jgi:hypothetical protein
MNPCPMPGLWHGYGADRAVGACAEALLGGGLF